MTRRLLFSGAIVAALVMTSLVPSPAARAELTRPAKAHWTQWQQFKPSTILSYKTTKWSGALNRCLVLQLYAKFKFQWKPDPNQDSPPKAYRRVTVMSPRLDMTTKRSCAPGSARRNVQKVDFKQVWKPQWVGAKDCDLNPSVGVGIPLSVSFSVTPECSERKLKGARRTTSPGGVDSHFFQVNSGSVLKIGQTSAKEAPLCWSFNVTAQVYKLESLPGSGSAAAKPITGRVCAKKATSKCPGDPTCENSGVSKVIPSRRGPKPVKNNSFFTGFLVP